MSKHNAQAKIAHSYLNAAKNINSPRILDASIAGLSPLADEAEEEKNKIPGQKRVTSLSRPTPARSAVLKKEKIVNKLGAGAFSANVEPKNNGFQPGHKITILKRPGSAGEVQLNKKVGKPQQVAIASASLAPKSAIFQTSNPVVALSLAFQNGEIENVKALLKSKTSYNVPNKDGKTAVDICIAKNNPDLSRLLCQSIVQKYTPTTGGGQEVILNKVKESSDHEAEKFLRNFWKLDSARQSECSGLKV